MSAESFSDEYDANRDADATALNIVEDLLGFPVLDSSAGREGEVRDPESVEECLEFSHVDALAYDEGVAYGLGLRVRPYKSDRRDLSIRVVPRSGEGETEYQDLLRAMESGGIVPRWYVIGFKTAPVVRDLSGVVIRHLFVVDARSMLRALDEERIDVDGPRPSGRGNPGDDSEAIYVSIDDLRDLGAVDYEFHNAEW